MHKTPALKNNVNFCKDHRDKTEVADPLAVEDLITYKLNDRRLLKKKTIFVSKHSFKMCLFFIFAKHFE